MNQGSGSHWARPVQSFRFTIKFATPIVLRRGSDNSTTPVHRPREKATGDWEGVVLRRRWLLMERARSPASNLLPFLLFLIGRVSCSLESTLGRTLPPPATDGLCAALIHPSGYPCSEHTVLNLALLLFDLLIIGENLDLL